LRRIAHDPRGQGGRVAGLSHVGRGSRHQDQQREHGQHRRERQAAGLVGALVQHVVADRQQQHAQARRRANAEVQVEEAKAAAEGSKSSSIGASKSSQ
jgi:hypothetical protein